MSILTRDEIKNNIRRRRIKIEPYDESLVGSGSVDLTLGNIFRVFKKSKKIYHIKNDSHFHEVTKEIFIKDGRSIAIKPGEMILAVTKEKLTLPDNICGWLQGRSRFARFGLAVHVTASFMQPGISNQQVLEIVNMGNAPLALYPGTKICQFIFEECKGRAKYQGIFSKQTKP
jgi:dCTP deaminase